MPHQTCEPPILYLGTPVVVLSTLNDDGSTNLAPMSSAWWLGWRCVLGLGAASQSVRNLQRQRQAVINLPSQHEVGLVDRLALTTGAADMPGRKRQRGYRHVADKWACSGFTPQASHTVAPQRARECQVQLEAVLEAAHPLAAGDPLLAGACLAFEMRITRVHVHPALSLPGQPDRIDPDRWRPLIMSFQQFYGLAPQRLMPSALATIPEAAYRSPDVDRARQALEPST